MMLTVVGLLNWDPSVFDELSIPDDALKQVLIEHIAFTCGELPLVYSDPETFKRMVGIWSQVRAYGWKALWESTKLEYNPIENYDRFEDSSEDRESEASGTGSSSGQSSNKVRGFDGGRLVDKDSATDSGESTTRATGQEGVTRTSHIHGNIGVTTSQQMIMSEREVAEFSFYDKLAEEFKQRFCILVY